MPEIVLASHPIDVSYPLSTSGREWGVGMARLRAGREGSLSALKYLSISCICLQIDAYVFSCLSHSVIFFN